MCGEKQNRHSEAHKPGNNLSGVAEQFATQFWAYATQYYVGVAVFGMDNSSFAHSRLLNCYTIFLGQIIPCKHFFLAILSLIFVEFFCESYKA